MLFSQYISNPTLHRQPWGWQDAANCLCAGAPKSHVSLHAGDLRRGKSALNCPADCPAVRGDGNREYSRGENAENCLNTSPNGSPANGDCPALCGDGYCDYNRCGWESCALLTKMGMCYASSSEQETANNVRKADLKTDTKTAGASGRLRLI